MRRYHDGAHVFGYGRLVRVQVQHGLLEYVVSRLLVRVRYPAALPTGKQLETGNIADGSPVIF